MGIVDQGIKIFLSCLAFPWCNSPIIYRQIVIWYHLVFINSHHPAKTFTGSTCTKGIIVVEQMRIGFFKFDTIQLKSVVEVVQFTIWKLANITCATSLSESGLDRITDPVGIFLIPMMNHKTVDDHENLLFVHFFELLLEERFFGLLD